VSEDESAFGGLLRSVNYLDARWMKIISDLTHVILGCHLGLSLVGLSVFENWACLQPRVAITHFFVVVAGPSVCVVREWRRDNGEQVQTLSTPNLRLVVICLVCFYFLLKKWHRFVW
jgi:hypothetical protein